MNEDEIALCAGGVPKRPSTRKDVIEFLGVLDYKKRQERGESPYSSPITPSKSSVRIIPERLAELLKGTESADSPDDLSGSPPLRRLTKSQRSSPEGISSSRNRGPDKPLSFDTKTYPLSSFAPSEPARRKISYPLGRPQDPGSFVGRPGIDGMLPILPTSPAHVGAWQAAAATAPATITTVGSSPPSIRPLHEADSAATSPGGITPTQEFFRSLSLASSTSSKTADTGVFADPGTPDDEATPPHTFAPRYPAHMQEFRDNFLRIINAAEDDIDASILSDALEEAREHDAKMATLLKDVWENKTDRGKGS